MAQPGPSRLLRLPDGLLDNVVGCLELWDLAAARAACRALRASAGRRARRLAFTPASTLRERSGYGFVQVGSGRSCVARTRRGCVRWGAD
jgi:hypothetical protein